MVCLVVFIGTVILDILTKLWALDVLKGEPSIKLWNGVFHLTYVENRGAAFGMFQNGRVFFVVATVLVLLAIIFFAIKYKKKSKVLDFGLSLVAAGAVGNLIDRIRLGFVVDFFDFCLIDFPVFNVADIAVCIGAVLVGIFIIFFEDTLKEKKDCQSDET